ncbi:RNA polymerase II-associated protein [Flagelloscypha sp. PMI_526]|nr:RNA polymerase II-associated protein [Flagelloscypha sp. PMI_526]
MSHIDPALLSTDIPMQEDAAPDAEMDDLFGNEEDADDESRDQPIDSESELPPDAAERKRLEYEEDDNAPQMAIEYREAQVGLANLPKPKSSDGNTWVVRLPSYMSVNKDQFHPDSYIEHDGDEDADPNAQSMTIKLKVQSTVRWRWAKDASGNDIRQSNSRIIRWSDGSVSLRLGKELYDISQNIDTSGGVSKSSFGSTPSGPVTAGGKAQGLSYLVAQHKRSQLLQAETLVTGTMSLRPADMNSEAHQLLVQSVGQKNRRTKNTLITALPEKDPERELAELKKASDKRDRKRERELYGSTSKTPRKRSRRSEYVGDSDEEAEVVYGDSDDDHIGRHSPKKKGPSKKNTEDDYEKDDFVTEDDSDEEYGEKSSKSKSRKRRQAQAEASSEDDLDKADRRIEAQARKKRSSKGGAFEAPEADVAMASDVDEEDASRPSRSRDDDMDIESEDEDEDEFKVRKPGGGGRKVALEDEDDDDDE